jgi:hypothetical protein
MTDQWLLNDIKKLLNHRNRVVVLDPSGQCRFVLSILENNGIRVLQTNGAISEHWQQVKEELLLRYEAETGEKDKPIVFYVTRPVEKMSFLFDYCFTHGCLDLSHPQNWLKKKIFSSTGLQVQLDNPLLLTAAKLGINKDLDWWKRIVLNLQELIDLDEELLPFLHDPEGYMSRLDPDIKRLFEEKIHEVLSQQYMAKPVKTLAEEVAKKMLDGLAGNEISDTLLHLYYKWADSSSYRPSLETYIRNHKLNGSTNPLNAHPDHCFEKLDLIALKQIAENIRDRAYVTGRLHKLKSRIFSSRAKLFVPPWWMDIWTIFETGTNNLSTCKDLNAFIEYYTGYFSKVDRAIRNLYSTFLNTEDLIRPLQEHYEDLNHQVLQTWFNFWSDYKSDQQGYIVKVLSSAKGKTAIIVGDGIRYEIADYVATKLQKHLKVDKQIMLAGLPSETEHNMSALYLSEKKSLSLHKDREASLQKATGKDIKFIQLEQLNYGLNAEYLVLTYKDIDSAGEKLQQGAIKLFAEFESVLIDKITLLINMGYNDVYLVTDHGFVLTGLLDEADKIDPDVSGKKEVHERYIRTVEKQTNSEWIGIEEKYDDLNYVYMAKNHRPFKSKGVYGYSHGGFTPQEIIIPKFRFSKQKAATSSLSIRITNKSDLAEVNAELFVIKIEASKEATDLFAAQRKVQIKLYSGNKEFQSSNIMSLVAGTVESIECSLDNNSKVQVVLLDAETKEQLDMVTITKSNLRDLGGL